MNGRSILAVLSGIIGGGIIVYLIHGVSRSIVPIDETAIAEAYRSGSRDLVAAVHAKLPVTHYLLAILADAVGIIGGMVIGRLFIKNDLMPIVGIAAILLLTQLLQVLIAPFPTWFRVADLMTSLGLAIGYIGYIYGKYRKA